MRFKSIFLILLIFMISLFLGFDTPFQLTSHSASANSHINGNLEAHSYLEITSNSQLLELAAQEGWEGDGSVSHPYRIANYNFGEGVNGSEIFDEVTSEFSYTYGGFSTFSLVLKHLQDVEVYIENNQFKYSVLIVDSPQVSILNNEWINPDYSSNLFIYGNKNLIKDNTFYGSNQNCETDPNVKATPRVYIRGYESNVIHNLFEMDTGCHRIAQLTIANTAGTSEDSFNVNYNLFQTSDIGVEVELGRFIKGTFFILNNDFEIGDFGIVTNGQHIEVHNNNFVSSEIGENGQQDYPGMVKPITELFYERGVVEGPTVNCGFTIVSNYYSNWVSPDENRDGIVDQAYVACSGFSVFDDAGVFATDDLASTTPFSGYHEFDLDMEGENRILTYLIIGISSLIVSLALGFRVLTNFSKSKPIFSGELSGPSKEFIKELFQSQTVLYYTLVGQSRISDKELESNIRGSIPKNILDFKFLFHPLRLSITKMLYENLELTSVDVKDILNISWNDYRTHVTALSERGYIKIVDGFVNGSKRQVLSIEPQGIAEYKALIELLHLFLDNSTDFAAYITAAQQRLDLSDQDLYPNS